VPSGWESKGTQPFAATPVRPTAAALVSGDEPNGIARAGGLRDRRDVCRRIDRSLRGRTDEAVSVMPNAVTQSWRRSPQHIPSRFETASHRALRRHWSRRCKSFVMLAEYMTLSRVDPAG